jgi:GcrA cell cycle regulator
MQVRGARSDQELKRLGEIVASGATPLRAAATLKRNRLSCKNQARKLGTPFTPLWKMRKAIRAKCAAAEKDLAR